MLYRCSLNGSLSIHNTRLSYIYNLKLGHIRTGGMMTNIALKRKSRVDRFDLRKLLRKHNTRRRLNVDMFNGPVRWNEETNTPITKRLRNYFKISPDPQEQMVFCLEMIQMQIMVIIGYFAGAFFLLILKWIYVP
ncbi:hypothetical protein ACHWQZ_G003903 [Mnemiopsis leidyi]